MNKFLSVDAPEFIPRTVAIGKPKKSKDERACPRKRRKPKNKETEKHLEVFNHGYGVYIDS